MTPTDIERGRAHGRKEAVEVIRERMRAIEHPRDDCDKQQVCLLGQIIFELKNRK